MIVHEEAARENPAVYAEIIRIMQEEEHVLVDGNPTTVDYHVPRDANLLVCGAYHGNESWDHRCVDEQVKALRRKGLSPKIYLPATVCLDP